MTLVPEPGRPDALLLVKTYLDSALADNTRRAYRSDLEHFKSWGGVIPASPEMIATYLSTYAETLSIATLLRRLVSISKAHTMQGYTDSTKTELVRLTLRGIRRLHGKPQAQVSPLVKEDIILLLSHMRDDIKGHRDRALLLLGFCAALRRSELVAVRIEDLEFTAHGIILTIPRSKTDQTGQGRKVGIPRGRGKICPVQSIEVWLSHLGAVGSPMFRSITKGGILSAGGLSDRAVANIIKTYAERAGLNPDNYSGHSLRAGLCTSAAQYGVPSWKIRAQSGHSSDTMLARYIRDSDLFSENAADLF